MRVTAIVSDDGPRPDFVPGNAVIEHVDSNTVRIGGPGSGIDVSIDRGMLHALYSAALYYPGNTPEAEAVRSELDALAFCVRALLPRRWEPPVS